MPDPALQEILCCIGQPVAGNPTQFMMQRALARARLDWCYLTLEVAPADLPDAIRGVRALGFRGANVSLPHKMAAAPLLDQLREPAQLTGTVSCIARGEDGLVGDATDGRAFVEALREVCDLAGKRVLLLGAGGVARAIAAELARHRVAEIGVANRTAQRGETLVHLLQERLAAAARPVAWETPLAVPDDVDLLINATAIGVLDAEARVPVDPGTLRPSLVVADVVFNPPRTRLLDEAEQAGCTVVDGLGMLVNQVAIDFHIWTGQPTDKTILREAVEEYLEI